MSVADVRAAAKVVLKSVAGISNVLDVLAWRTDPEFFLENFAEADGRVCGWQMRAVERTPNEHLGFVDRRIEVGLLGILGYRDLGQSRAEAETMLENVIAAFRATSNRRLDGAADWIEPPFRTDVSEAFVDAGDGDRIYVHRIEVLFVAVLETALQA